MEVVLGLEQHERVLLVGHQHVDVVALRSHNLNKRSDTIEAEAIEAPEVEHHTTVVDGCIGNEQREYHYEGQAHDDRDS